MSGELCKKIEQLESRIVRLEEKINYSSQRIGELEHLNGILTSAVVSAFVTAISMCVVKLLKG